MAASYRADHVGSFLRPQELLDAHAPGADAARRQRQSGNALEPASLARDRSVGVKS